MSKNTPKSKKNLEVSIITLGNGRVGKTSLIVRFTSNAFTLNYLSSSGIDSTFKSVKISDGETVRVQITDTAGQERYSSLSYNYIKHAEGIVFVYDISDKKSFKEVSNWIANVEEAGNATRPTILIGNKSDLEEKRKVSTEDGKEFADQKGMHFYETSCQTGENVENAFMDLVRQIYETKKSKIQNENDENIKINKKHLKKNKKKKSC